MKKTLIPQNDRVLIKPIESDEEMYGNIIIPDMGKEKPEMGEVVAIGPGRLSEFSPHYIRVSAQVGDIVLIPKVGSLRIDFEDQEYFIVQDREILATVKQAGE